MTITPERFWANGNTVMMRSAVTFVAVGARGSQPHTKTMDLAVKDITTGPATAGSVARGKSAGIDSVVAQQATCDILNLVLGPLDLNLLGLQIHLDQVVLDIVAVPGPGNLLGNLLCAVAGLLDGSGSTNQIVALLNQILAVLQGLLGGLGG